MKGTVILGAGPTGLGAAYRLTERGETDFEIFERAGRVGGLATSFEDPHGYTWDVSGHIIFSNYPYFNAFLEKMLGKEGIRRIDRESWMSLDADVKGDAYEGLLERNAEDLKSGAGQYFTPRALIRGIVEVMRPEPGMEPSTSAR